MDSQTKKAMAMLNFGYLIHNPANKDAPFSGKLNSRKVKGSIRLVRQPKRSPEAPDYKVELDGFEAGGAWIKPLKNGGEFLSLTLDDPEWEKTLNVSAFFRSDDANRMNIVWKRERQAEPGKKAQPVDSAPEAPMPDDETATA